MVRWSFHVVLTLAAIGITVTGVISHATIPCLRVAVGNGDWFVVHFFEGLVRIFWIESGGQAIEVVSRARGPHLRIASVRPPWPSLPDGAMGVDPGGPGLAWWGSIPIGARWQVMPLGGRWRFKVVGRGPESYSQVLASFVRFPVWLPASVLLLPPILWVHRGWRRRRRRVRNQCLDCGYNLTGLIETRCPECGAPFAVARRSHLGSGTAPTP